MSTEQEMLNLAEDFKNIVQRKDAIIEMYKDKLEEVENLQRDCEYILSQIDYLIDYKKDISNKEERPFLKRIAESVKKMIRNVDRSRIVCQEEIEEDILLELNLE